MSTVNKVTILGHISSDIDVKVSEQNITRAKFTVAVQRKSNPGSPVIYDTIPVLVWGELAESIQKTGKKDSQILAKGRLTVSVYDNPDGVRSWSTYIEARDITITGESVSPKSTETVAPPKADTTIESVPATLDESDFDFGVESAGLDSPKSFQEEVGDDVPF